MFISSFLIGRLAFSYIGYGWFTVFLSFCTFAYGRQGITEKNACKLKVFAILIVAGDLLGIAAQFIFWEQIHYNDKKSDEQAQFISIQADKILGYILLAISYGFDLVMALLAVIYSGQLKQEQDELMHKQTLM